MQPGGRGTKLCRYFSSAETERLAYPDLDDELALNSDRGSN